MRKIFAILAFLIVSITGLRAAGPSGTLPVIYVNIENGQEVITKDPYLNAVYWLDPKGCEGIEAIGSAEAPLVTKIKGRGNYTFNGFEKKPYRLKLDAKAALCGMSASKHFGLLAHADDNRGFLRNTLGFKVSQIVGLPWTPSQYPVEVVVNGTYRGLYFLTELIRIDKNRVNIDKWIDEDEMGVALDKWIEGGTLVELDNYEEPAQIQFYNPGAPEPLRFTYDKSVDPGFEPDGYIDWLKSSLGAVNNLILNGDRNSDELWNLVDIDDLARFIVVQEFMDNYESFHGSCYLYRQKGDGEKWHFSPVWDFGSAFQRNHPDHSFWEKRDGNDHYNHWIGDLLEFPALRAKIAEYWELLKQHRGEIDTYASSFISQITSAAACDKERWPQYGNDNLNDKLNQVMGYLNSSTSFINKEYAGGPATDNTFYLLGDFNGWKNDKAFTKVDNHYELVCDTEISGKWKINNGSWDGIDLGKGSDDIKVDELYTLSAKGGNFSTTIPAGAKLILNYSQAKSTLLIQTEGGEEPPVIVDPVEKNIYLVGDFNSWGQSHKLTKNGANYELVIDNKITGKWKFNDGTWTGLDFGKNDSDLEFNKEYNLKYKGVDFTKTLPANAKLILHYVSDNEATLLIEAEEIIDVPVSTKKTVMFVDAHSTPWEAVHVWTWDADNNTEHFTGDKWPGDKMTRIDNTSATSMRAESYPTWIHTFDTQKPVPNLMIVFNNGNENGNDKEKTGDMAYGDFFTRSDDGVVSGISEIVANNGVEITGSNGMLTVRSEKSFMLTVTDIAGRTKNFEINPGTTVINLGHGFYIVANKKIRL